MRKSYFLMNIQQMKRSRSNKLKPTILDESMCQSPNTDTFVDLPDDTMEQIKQEKPRTW